MFLFDENKKWYKANLHAHTTLSDGKLSPDECVEKYKNQNYSILAITDHRKSYIKKDEKDFILLSGSEIDVFYRGNNIGEQFHIVGLDLPENLDFSDISLNSHPQEIVDKILSLGGFPIIAHPAWSLNRPDFIASIKGLAAAEIYNSISGLPFNGDRGGSELLLDVTATMKCVLPLVASDDSHSYTGEECKSWTMIQPDEFSYNGVMNALKAGKFYASRGPEIYQIEVTKEKISVKCSECVMATFMSNLPTSGGRTQITKNGSTEYEYERKMYEDWVRIELVDRNGNKAWSSYIK